MAGIRGFLALSAATLAATLASLSVAEAQLRLPEPAGQIRLNNAWGAPQIVAPHQTGPRRSESSVGGFMYVPGAGTCVWCGPELRPAMSNPSLGRQMPIYRGPVTVLNAQPQQRYTPRLEGIGTHLGYKLDRWR